MAIDTERTERNTTIAAMAIGGLAIVLIGLFALFGSGDKRSTSTSDPAPAPVVPSGPTDSVPRTTPPTP